MNLGKIQEDLILGAGIAGFIGLIIVAVWGAYNWYQGLNFY